jgi:hypothetical protein
VAAVIGWPCTTGTGTACHYARGTAIDAKAIRIDPTSTDRQLACHSGFVLNQALVMIGLRGIAQPDGISPKKHAR